MKSSSPAVLTTVALIMFLAGCGAGSSGETPDSGFTGETLTLLYVTDVRRSVSFYEAIGFELNAFYDYETDTYTRDWKPSYPPGYAEVIQPGIRIGLTTAEEPEQVYGGGVRHYFIVEDVHSHFEMIQKNGIVAVPNEVEVRPWMSFITVPDPDNHQIVFGTKNQIYYDQAAEQVKNLDP